MLKSINIFNVKFGDCFLLRNGLNKDSSDKMLVDFGSIQKINQTVIDAVNFELTTAERTYLMVTHFHSDHYKGIKYLNNRIIFDEIYLPNYFSKDIVKLQFTLLSLLNESHPAYQVAYNLLSVIPDVFRHIDKHTRILFVKRGEQIYNNIDSFRILWPDVNSFDIQAKKLYEEIVSYYDINAEKQLDLERLTEEYFSTLPRLTEQEGNSSVLQFEDFNLNPESVLQIKYNIEFISKTKNKPKKRLKRGLSKEISSYQNNICICFDNKNEAKDPNKNVLFLSDICREHLQDIIARTDAFKLNDRYFSIKVPHHGTKDYFVPNLPLSEYMIISNGYAKNSGWQITALYGWHYKKLNFICADYSNTCDYALAERKCDAYNPATCTCGFMFNYELVL